MYDCMIVQLNQPQRLTFYVGLIGHQSEDTMTSTEGLTITRQSSVTSDDITNTQPQIPPLYEWLNYVTRMLAPNDISLMKLCLYPTFKNRQERDRADTIPDIFHAMVGTCTCTCTYMQTMEPAQRADRSKCNVGIRGQSADVCIGLKGVGKSATECTS